MQPFRGCSVHAIMCGIVGYIGKRQAYPVLVKGLHRLEYRGYDSAGVALINPSGRLNVYKSQGKVSDLEDTAQNQDLTGCIGIAHTRWATHGEPGYKNAHPHLSESGRLAIVHNGIIENYAALREMLLGQGRTFKSDTDTEVVVQLIEHLQEKDHLSFPQSVQKALQMVQGSYAVAVLDKQQPDTIVAARKGSPLVVGVGDDELFLGSDASPIIEYTNRVIYLEDEDMVILRMSGQDSASGRAEQAVAQIMLMTIRGERKTPQIQRVSMDVSQLEKGGYDHFMLKEICEQPQSLRSCLQSVKQTLSGPDAERIFSLLQSANRVLITACGTSWHAGLVAKYAIEQMVRVSVDVDYASELRYRQPVINNGDIVIAISQSGETADTLAAIDMAKKQGARVLSICNVIGSSIPRASDEVIYTMVGPEIGVASTKAFTAQVTVLTMLALVWGHRRNTLDDEYYTYLMQELDSLPDKIAQVLDHKEAVRQMAQTLSFASSCLYIGRSYNYPVALEGALKLKEISYIHAEGYPAAEMKHGPIALISQEMPVVTVATASDIYDKLVSNIQEIRARQGRVMAVVNEGDTEVERLADVFVEVPRVAECLSPIVNIVPLQLLSYYVACLKGCDVDQPRNLAKSVTVE